MSAISLLLGEIADRSPQLLREALASCLDEIGPYHPWREELDHLVSIANLSLSAPLPAEASADSIKLIAALAGLRWACLALGHSDQVHAFAKRTYVDENFDPDSTDALMLTAAMDVIAGDARVVANAKESMADIKTLNAIKAEKNSGKKLIALQTLMANIQRRQNNA